MLTAIPKPPESHWIHPARWLAISSMLADHLARYLHPGNLDHYWLAATFGRLAFPLFAAMLAWHLLFHTRSPLLYAGRILLIGLVAQPVYALMIGIPLSYPWLNVCFTLAAGLLLGSGLKHLLALAQQPGWRPDLLHWLGMALALLLAWLVAPWLDYGLPGILLVPCLVLVFWLMQQPASSSQSLIGSVVLTGFVGLGLNSFGLPTFSSLLALAFILLGVKNSGRLQRMKGYMPPLPRWLWLSFYPGHLLLVVMLSHAVRH
ncbi:TraX family protein [Marinospirillum alkaliphilum]|nr:TraX family protein [Marinospirillum alkaliphilum]